MEKYIFLKANSMLLSTQIPDSNKSILLTNIQHFCLHDGPGIRTTIFLKGCDIRCPWCSNPENIEKKIQSYVKDNIRGIYGKYMSPEEVFNEIIKDVIFYTGEINVKDWKISDPSLLEKLPGGVTFSGGEALLQINNLEPLIRLLREIPTSPIHIAVETSLFISQEQLNKAIDFIDLFYVDIKILNKDRALNIYHGCIENYLENIKILMNSKKPVVFRIPLIGNYTDDLENRKQIIQFIKYNRQFGNILKIELIKGHNLGNDKYNSLKWKVPKYCEITDTLMEDYKTQIEQNTKIKTQICKAF